MTPFTKIYERFLSSITEYKIAKMDAASAEANLQYWLEQAISHWPTERTEDIDTTDKVFNQELSNSEISVLAKYMVISYLDTFSVNESVLVLNIGSKDTRTYSGANQIKSITELKEQLKSDANTIISRNSYKIKNIKEWMKGDKND